MSRVVAWHYAAVFVAAYLLSFSAVATGFGMCDYIFPCGPDGTCVTEEKSPFYSCKCFNGFEWSKKDKRCIEKDLCKPNPCGAGTCSLTGEGTYECSCPTTHSLGYNLGKLTCIASSSACDKNPCGPAGDCTPVAANKYKCACYPGYAQKGGKGFCLELNNPCVGNPCTGIGNKCVPLLGGGYRCECGVGYFLPPKFRKAGGFCVLRKFMRLRRSKGMRPKKGRGLYWKRGGKRHKKPKVTVLH